ncbi:hypothetical protein ABKN59_003125 [Abortiporus biennis]
MYHQSRSELALLALYTVLLFEIGPILRNVTEVFLIPGDRGIRQSLPNIGKGSSSLLLTIPISPSLTEYSIFTGIAKDRTHTDVIFDTSTRFRGSKGGNCLRILSRIFNTDHTTICQGKKQQVPHETTEILRDVREHGRQSRERVPFSVSSSTKLNTEINPRYYNLNLAERISKLRSAVKLLVEASEQAISAWESDPSSASILPGDLPKVPSFDLHNARQTILGASGTCAELVQDPQQRLFEVSFQYYEARALHVTARARIAEILDEGDKVNGVSIDELSKKTGIKSHKLARVLRMLCSAHIFAEGSTGFFTNNYVSEQMLNNEPLLAYIMLPGGFGYDASAKLPQVLVDPIKSQSESDRQAAFQASIGSNKTLWEWLEEPITLPDGTKGAKPDLELFGLSMVGVGRVQGPPLHSDYPWGDLENATVVDVGGGVGGMCIDLSRKYPNLNFIVEDRAPVVEQAPRVWAKENPEALHADRVKFIPHDFFTEQPVKNADVYHLRFILHDWPDDECIQILSSLVPALGPNSRILISDQVMRTTCGSQHSKSAPHPLPANYGLAHRYLHELDLAMLTLFNGRERTAEEIDTLAKKAGLEVVKIWECRGVIWITELRVRRV